MTRINCVPPEELSDKHLLAEYRELPRVFKLARPLERDECPTHYVMGPGHVKFFYDKLTYLLNRQRDIVWEMRQRGWNPLYNPDTLAEEHHEKFDLWNDWEPTPEALKLNRQRIAERLRDAAA